MLRGKWNRPKSGSERENSKQTPEAPSTEVLGKSAIQATFAEQPHRWGHIGASLEAEERAGPPKSDAERAERAARWRLCHLLYELPSGPLSPAEQEEIDKSMAAAYPESYGSADETTPDAEVAVEDRPPES
jgi:hypothetical protein